MGLYKDWEKGRRGQWVVSDVPFGGHLSSRCRFSQGQQLGCHPILWALGERNGDHLFQSHLQSLWNRRLPWSWGWGAEVASLASHLKGFWAHTNLGHYWVSRTRKGKWKTYYSVCHSKWKINQCFGRIMAKLLSTTFFFFWLYCMWHLSSPTRDRSRALCRGRTQNLNHQSLDPQEVPTELECLQRCCKTGMLLGPSTSHWWMCNGPRALPHVLPRHSAPPLNCTHKQYKRHNIEVGCFCYPCCLGTAPGRICGSFLFTHRKLLSLCHPDNSVCCYLVNQPYCLE